MTRAAQAVRAVLAGAGAATVLQDTGDGADAGAVATFTVPVTQTGTRAYERVEEVQRLGDAALPAGGFELLLTGEPAQEAAAMNAIRADLGIYVPIEVGLIVVILFVSLGSLSAMVALLGVLGVATAATMGGHGWTGAALNGVTSVVPSSLLGLSVATSVHILLAWQHGLREGMERHAALMHSSASTPCPSCWRR